MSRRKAIAIVAVSIAAAAVAPVVTPVTRAAPKGDPVSSGVREIDLPAIYSTSIQKNLKDVYRSLKEDSPEQGGTIRHSWKCKISALLTIVRGEDIREAVLATARFVTAKRRPAGPVGPDDKSASKKLWLFVYLGHAHSTPHNWLISPPTVFGTRVRFMYTSFEGWLSDEPIAETTGYRVTCTGSRWAAWLSRASRKPSWSNSPRQYGRGTRPGSRKIERTEQKGSAVSRRSTAGFLVAAVAGLTYLSVPMAGPAARACRRSR